MQATRFYFSIERNLWRIEWALGLRPARRRAQTEPERILVARDGARTRRCGRLGRLDSDESRGLEGKRTRRDIQRSDGGLPNLQGTAAGRSADREKRSETVSELRRQGSDRTARVQPDVQNLRRRHRGRIKRDLSST